MVMVSNLPDTCRWPTITACGCSVTVRLVTGTQCYMLASEMTVTLFALEIQLYLFT